MFSRLLSRRLSASVLVTLMLFALPSLAAAPSWTVAGAPTGGNVYKVIVDPTDSNKVYALSDPGVYQSSDGGANWTLVLSDPSHILDLAMAPSDHLTLYATTFNNGVYKSADGGGSWRTTQKPVPVDYQVMLQHVSVDPTDASVVYVLTDSSGVRKSSDGGDSWHSANGGLSSVISGATHLDRLVVDPSNTLLLYLAVSQDSNSGATPLAGLYTSSDGGGNWSVLSGLSGVDLGDVDMDPTDPTHLVAVGGCGFYDITNSGANVASSTPGVCLGHVKFDPSDHLHIYGGGSPGLSQSPDGGASWSSSSELTAAQVYDVAIDPTTPSKVFAGTAAWGLYVSSDSGTSWALSNAGIDDVMVNAMVSANDAIYVASEGTGVLKSTDGGVSWDHANNGISTSPSGININALVEDPKTPAILYAGTQFGLFQTQDSGGSWSLLNNGITDHYTLAVAVDPQVPATVYAGTMHKLFKSVDGGAHWSPTGSGLPSSFPDIVSIAVDPTDSDIVFAGSDSYGLYESSDGGAHFSPAGASLASATWITSIAFDPADPKTVYVATINNIGFFKSVDGGVNWTESDNGFPSILDYTGFAQIIIDPADPSTLFVMPYQPGDTAIGTYYSTDAGADWSPLTTGSVSATRATRHERGILGSSSTQSRSKASVTMSWVAVNPKKPSQLTAVGSDHKLYRLSSISDLQSSGSSGGGGSGSGGGGGGSGGTASSGGGGPFPPLVAALLLGIAVTRRRSLAR